MFGAVKWVAIFCCFHCARSKDEVDILSVYLQNFEVVLQMGRIDKYIMVLCSLPSKRLFLTCTLIMYFIIIVYL